MPDFKSAMFTEIAKGVGAALQPYAKAIDLLREVSDWGPDKHGQQLTFEIVFPDKDQPNDPPFWRHMLSLRIPRISHSCCLVKTPMVFMPVSVA